jgi:hypothetical protein
VGGGDGVEGGDGGAGGGRVRGGDGGAGSVVVTDGVGEGEVGSEGVEVGGGV